MKNFQLFNLFILSYLSLGWITPFFSQITPPTYNGITEICTNQSASILAEGEPGASFSWWDSQVAGNLLGTGVVYTTEIFEEVGIVSIFLEQTVGFETSARTEVIITINLTPVISSTTPDIACAGSTIQLSASGAETYLWNPGGLFDSPSITITNETQTFSVFGTSSEGCQSESIDVTVQVPYISASEDIVVCEGDEFELTASGGNEYSWSPVGLTGESVSIQASSTTTYVVSGTFSDNECIATEEVIVTVNPNPIVNASTSTPTVASGDLALLNSSSNLGSSFRWDSDHGPANIIGTDVYVQPTLTTNYIATHESIHGCIGSSSMVTVTVLPIPQISGVTTVCSSDGFSTSLTAISEASNSISWYNSSDGPSIYEGDLFDLSGINEIVNDVWVSEDGGINRKNIHVYAPSPYNMLTDNTQGFTLPNRTLCLGETALLSAELIGNVEQVNWYLESEETAFASTLPSNPTPVSPEDTTIYLVEGFGQQQEITFNANVSNNCLSSSCYAFFTGTNNGSYQTWIVPEGVYSLEIDAIGASQGISSSGYGTGNPGKGGRVEATMTVTPGDTLYIFVGGHGEIRAWGGYGTAIASSGGGWNGGGNSGGSAGNYLNAPNGGGGATDIRINGLGLHNRVLVAGGGGGATSSGGTGGHGGGLEAPGAGGGTQTHGGTTGTGSQQGSFGLGGSNGSGGGGGGWFGGSCGFGGSSYTNPQYFENVSHTVGYQSYHGQLIIRYGKNDCTSPKIPLVLNVTSELDALGICGGQCQEDLDADGICDDEDACVGYFDVCGVCNGPGDIYECGCSDIASFSCDCDGNTYDALGYCGGICLHDFDQDGGCNVNGVSSFCAGEGTTLTAIGAGNITYAWWDALEGGNLLSTANVYSTPIYSEAGTWFVYLQRVVDGVAEDSRVTLTLTVKEIPTVFVSAQNMLICQGEQTTLFAEGADSYVWSPGNYQGFPTIELNESQIFSVIGTTAGCSSSATSLEITVPEFDVITNETICFGDEIEISFSGATYFTWPDGVVADTRTLSPTETTTYLITGTHNDEECNSQREFVINVNPTPITQVSGDQTLGDGLITTISATSDFATEYDWSVASGPYGVSGSTISVSPTETTTFIAEGFSVDGCSSSDSLTIYINSLPEVQGETNLCLLSNGLISTSLTAIGTGPFAWYDAAENGNLLFIGATYNTGNISTTTSYWVSDNFGPRKKVTVYVNGAGMSLSADDELLCTGESAILTGQTIGGLVEWYEGDLTGSPFITVQSGESISVTPNETTTYYAQGTIDQTEIVFNYNGNNGGCCWTATNGAYQTWVVPEGVYSINIDASGASSAYNSGAYTCNGNHAGKGGRVETSMTVTPGETLYIFVGGHGKVKHNSGYGNTPVGGSNGGWNGGGNGSTWGGGGASDIRIGGTELHHRVLVAGGGGGTNNSIGCYAGAGGHGGGLEAPGDGGGFQGGTQTHGGYHDGTTSGGWGYGGSGSFSGGGGGWFGGSTSKSGLKAGGGSSYTNDQHFENVIHTIGYKTGHGQLTIRYGIQDCLSPWQSLTVEVTDELDIFDVCGGGCTEDLDSDGVCDDIDDCIGEYDNCGVCNGPGSVYDCGCFEMPETDCDCYGAQFDALGICGGNCSADVDQDGVCDDVDDCVGFYDDCGVCNGPGAIFECGCQDGGCTDPEACNYDSSVACENGSCLFVSGCMNSESCNYNLDAQCDDGSCTQLDALGVCGGDCSSDSDGDGICDSEDTCVGTFDACGVCNGPGPVFECGCEDGGCTDPEACNFDPDAACENGTCGYVSGCTDPGACNYNDLAICDDGSCFSNCTMTSLASSTSPPPYGSQGVMFAVNAINTIHIKSLSFLLNHTQGGSAAKPYSVYVRTEGICDGDLDGDGLCENPEAVPSSSDGWELWAQGNTQANSWYGFYTAAITEEFFLEVPAGESYAIYITSPQGVITSYGGSGHNNNGPLGSIVSSNSDLQITNGFAISYSGLWNCGYCGGSADDPDGIGTARFTGGVNYCRAVDGCMNSEACNFNALATCDPLNECLFPDGCTDSVACNYSFMASCDDGSCAYEYDECGVCGGIGDIYECGCSDIPAGDCDCDGNVLDVLGVCNGDCTADADGDMVCDDVDDCFGEYDECGVCNGQGILEGECDCDGNALDAVGVCGGTCTSDEDVDGTCDDVDDCVGAYDDCGDCNGPGILEGECDCDGNVLDECGVCGGAGFADGACDCDGNVLDECGVCGGAGFADGACDCDGNVVDECGVCGGVGIAEGACNCDGNVIDECGVCGGAGEIYECGCGDIPEGNCDCNGNTLDVVGICGGACTADEDTDGICDDVDDCVGNYDLCGICNGPGSIYECGCADIPEEDCDCDGTVLDALGVCGGDCSDDGDSDGICDDVDDCVGAYDECGVCNGPGAIYECGCGDIPEGNCDCNGNTLDVVGICGGACSADADADGICDDVDNCIGAFDDCGICNGPGAIFDCGCDNVPSGNCDCDGNQLDALGVCGGDCSADLDSDGICDEADDCVGTYDDCGICNGPGEIFDCGCNHIPSGDCNCDGNQLDALGVCGGSCAADVDSDGICDDVDDCVGAYDDCGVCNGPGSIFSCGCSTIPVGDCDCDGNVLDECGVCAGDNSSCVDCAGVPNGESVVDNCGVCNGNASCYGCTYSTAMNYDSSITIDDGSCIFEDCDLEAAYAAGVDSVECPECDPNAGYEDGYSDGVESVDITSDNQMAYDQGYAAGVGSIECEECPECDPNAGYEDGYSDGVESVDITSDNQMAYDQGYAAGVDSVECPGGDNSCPGDLDGNGSISTSDLLIFLSAFGDTCE
jgi:hypothetical protein